jgi:trafficking protein particle complex subunit 1
MTVHSFHIFDRRGKTLFTKRYIKGSGNEDLEQLSEQRKLIFGMLFSLRELSSSLSPVDGPGDIQLVKTGASTLYNYETVSGLRFVLYTTADTSMLSMAALNSPAGTPLPTVENSSNMTNPAVTEKIRGALQHIYQNIWVTFVVRSPMYKPLHPNIASTNFEAVLDSYLKGMSWFR